MTAPPQPDRLVTDSVERLQLARGTLAYFVAAYGITWLCLLPAVLARRGLIPGPAERYLLLAVPGTFGPLLAAVLLSRFQSGGAGVRALFRPLGTWRVNAGWYLVALGFPAVTYVAGMAVYTLFGGTAGGRWLYLPVDGQGLAAMIVVPFGEEVGWRGFALPRLQRRYGALVASLTLGVAWALWHIPMFLVAGLSPGAFVISVAWITAGSVIFSWIYNHTRGSLLLAVLAHAGAHLNNPNQALPGNLTPLAISMVALCVLACAVVLGDRPIWRGPNRLPTE